MAVLPVQGLSILTLNPPPHTKNWSTKHRREPLFEKKERDLDCYLFWPAPWWVLPSCGWWQKAPWSSAVPEIVPILKRLQNFSDFHAEMSPRHWSWLHRDLREYTRGKQGGVMKKGTEIHGSHQGSSPHVWSSSSTNTDQCWTHPPLGYEEGMGMSTWVLILEVMRSLFEYYYSSATKEKI